MKKSMKVYGAACTLLAAILPVAAFAACQQTEEEVTLQSINITAAPSKTEYKVGESFDAAGMVVTASYSDESTKAVTNYTYSPEGALALTDETVVVSYTEGGVTKTASQTITVSPAAELASIEITTQPAKTVYTVGDTFDKTGMEVTAKYSDQTSRSVTNYIWAPTGALAITDTAVTISYTENSITKTAEVPVTVNKESVVSLKITAPPTKLTYNLGDEFEPDGLEVTAVYDNGTVAPVALADCTVLPSGKLGTADTAVKVSYTEGEKTVYAYLNKKIVIEAPEVGAADAEVAEEILFSQTEKYTLDGGAVKGTWSSDGNTFDRLRCNKNETATITFSHDFSSLADKSLAGFRAIMSNARGGTVIEISTDNENWATLAEAGEGLNTIPADYKYPSSTIDGKTATDGANRNVYYCFYGLGEYLGQNATTAYIRFSYENPAEKGWVGVDVEGSDLMHSVVFYNKLDLARITGEITLSGLTVKTPPTKTEYFVGDVFDPAGLVLEAVWSDESKTEIADGYTCISTGALTEDDDAVTVSYTAGGVTKSVEVPVTVTVRPANLVSIEITAAPTKTVYKQGETFSAEGMVVTAHYDDGTTAEVAGFTVSPEGALTSDITSVTVSYLGKEAAQTIRVLQNALTDADKVVADELLFTDTENYTLMNNAYKGSSRYFNDEEGTEAVRLRAGTREGAYIQFEYTFADGVDLSQAGFMFYGLHTRMGTTVQISADGENWEYLFKAAAGDKTLGADWKEKANNIVGTKGGTNTDNNMYSMYYDISGYLTEGKTVYIRIGYEAPVEGVTAADTEGADIFGSVTFYSKLDLSKVVE